MKFKFIYYIVIGLLVIYWRRNYLVGMILNWRDKLRKKKGLTPLSDLPSSAEKAIFSPAETRRTFIVAIDIEEKGNGEVIFTIAKAKAKEV